MRVRLLIFYFLVFDLYTYIKQSASLSWKSQPTMRTHNRSKYLMSLESAQNGAEKIFVCDNRYCRIAGSKRILEDFINLTHDDVSYNFPFDLVSCYFNYLVDSNPDSQYWW